jgi:NitT/TauT family transport system permease protein
MIFSRAVNLPGLAFMAALVGFWALVSIDPALHGASLPPPWEVWRALIDELPTIAAQTAGSLNRTLIAFALGGAMGAGLGVAQAVSPVIRKTTGPLVEGLRPLPSVALIPLGIVLMGMGDGLNISLAAFACAWPAFVGAHDGVKGVNPLLIETAMTMNLSRGRIIRTVIVPATLPAAAASLRIGLGIAFAVEISVEMLVPRHGIGAIATMAAMAGHDALLYAAILAAALAGLALNHGFTRLTSALTRRYGPQWRTGA